MDSNSSNMDGGSNHQLPKGPNEVYEGYYTYLIGLQNDLLGVEAEFRAAMTHFFKNRTNLLRPPTMPASDLTTYTDETFDRLESQVAAIGMLIELDRMIEWFLPMVKHYSTIHHASIPKEDDVIILGMLEVIVAKKIAFKARLPEFQSDRALLYQQCEAAPAAPEQDTPDQAVVDE